jgi:NUDIX domain
VDSERRLAGLVGRTGRGGYTPATDLLLSYQPQGEPETRDHQRMLALAQPGSDPWQRSAPLRLTASALIVHPASARVLLRWHQRLEGWFQVGGHGDPGEDEPLAVALREPGEETGLTDLTPWPALA